MDETDHKKSSEQEGREQAEMARIEEETDKEDMSFMQLAQSPQDSYDETLKPKSAEEEGREQAQMARLEEEEDEDEGASGGEVMDETDHKKSSEQEGREQAEMARMEEETDKDMSFIQVAQSPEDAYDET